MVKFAQKPAHRNDGQQKNHPNWPPSIYIMTSIDRESFIIAGEPTPYNLSKLSPVSLN